MRGMHVGALVLAAIGVASCAEGQDAAPEGAGLPEGPGWTGLTEAEEIIEARRVLMLQTEEQMKPIDAFTSGEAIGAAELKAAAAALEALLLAFPHLFPPTTNLYEPDVLEPPTNALPAIWRDFAAFRSMAAAAEGAAAEIVEADDAATMRTAGLRLRATCDGCHAQFSKPYTPPVFTDEDYEFDFESVFPGQ